MEIKGQLEDGNANVIASEWIEADFPATYNFSLASVTITDARITQDVIDNYLVFAYFSFSDEFTTAYLIPFMEPFLRTFNMQLKIRLGEIVITEFRNNDIVGVDPIDGFMRYVLIPSTTTSKNGTSMLSKLKADGIDMNDYNAVAAYFGIK